MAYTHDYELELGEYTFEGEVEINNAGVLAYEEGSVAKMPYKTKKVVEKILDELSTLPVEYTDLVKFELSIKRSNT